MKPITCVKTSPGPTRADILSSASSGWRRMSGDGEAETADGIKEDVSASPERRVFKMKKCVCA